MWLSCSGSCLGILLFAIPFVPQKSCVVWRRFHWSRHQSHHVAQRDSVRAWSHNETHQMVYFLHAVYLLSLPTLWGAENQWRLEDEAQVWEKLKAQLSDLSNLMNFSSNVKPLEIRASLCIYRWNRSWKNGRSVVTTGELPTSATQLWKCDHSTTCGQNTNYVFDKEIARDGSNEINGDRFDEVKRMASIKDNSTRKTGRIRPAITKNGWQEKGVLHSMKKSDTLVVVTHEFHITNVYCGGTVGDDRELAHGTIAVDVWRWCGFFGDDRAERKHFIFCSTFWASSVMPFAKIEEGKVHQSFGAGDVETGEWRRFWECAKMHCGWEIVGCCSCAIRLFESGAPFCAKSSLWHPNGLRFQLCFWKWTSCW